MSLEFKTLFDTVTIDESRRVVIRKQGETPFAEMAGVEVDYMPPGSYSSESYPVRLVARDGSRIEIANDAFGVARRAAVSAARALGTPIHDLSLGKPATRTAEEWSVPLRQRLHGRPAAPAGLSSPGPDLVCSRAGDDVRFELRPGFVGRTLRRGLAETRGMSAGEWIYTIVFTALFAIPCLMLAPVILAIVLVMRALGSATLFLSASPEEVRTSGGIGPDQTIPAGDVQDVELYWEKGWRGRVRLQHVVIRSDTARLKLPLYDEAEAEWVRRHVLAALCARSDPPFDSAAGGR